MVHSSCFSGVRRRAALSRWSRRLVISAAVMLGCVAPASAASVRLLVDTRDILAGDWALPFVDDENQNGSITEVRPDNFDRLPTLTTPAGDVTYKSQLVFKNSWGIDMYPTGEAYFTTSNILPDIGDGGLFGPYFFFAFGAEDALFEPHIGSYSNNFRGPDSPDLPVDFAAYDTDITRGPFRERVFSGRFCFALRGVIPGGPTPPSCDALIDGALAHAPDVSLPAVPVPAALPLAVSGLALLAGLRWRRTVPAARPAKQGRARD